MSITVNHPNLNPEDCTAVPGAWLRDGQLSLRARGILAYMMSYGRPLTVQAIQAGGPEGRHAIQTALGELVAAGYVTRTKARRGYTYSAAEVI